MHARMLSVVVFLPELRTVARRVLLLDSPGPDIDFYVDSEFRIFAEIR